MWVCSPLDLVPEAVNGNFHLLHDVSYPKGNSVNSLISLIPPESSEVKYDCIDNVIKLVKCFGRNSCLGKTDVQDEFRNIDIHPSDYHLLGFIITTNVYHKSSSCLIFKNIYCALQWIMETKYQVAGMSHILEDFLFDGLAKSDKFQQDLDNYLT
jgi:hypothetical protein